MDDNATLIGTGSTPPTTVEEFHARLAIVSSTLPRRLRQCAEFMAANADRIAVSTVAELSASADVPPSALMRFCQILGFSGFSEMQRMFREAYSPGWPDYSTRLNNLKAEGAGSPIFDHAPQPHVQVGDSFRLRLVVRSIAKSRCHTVILRQAQPVEGSHHGEA